MAFIFFVNDGLNKISGDTEGFGHPVVSYSPLAARGGHRDLGVQADIV